MQIRPQLRDFIEMNFYTFYSAFYALFMNTETFTRFLLRSMSGNNNTLSNHGSYYSCPAYKKPPFVSERRLLVRNIVTDYFLFFLQNAIAPAASNAEESGSAAPLQPFLAGFTGLTGSSGSGTTGLSGSTTFTSIATVLPS